MSKLLVGLVPKGGEEFKYIIEKEEYIGTSSIEAICKKLKKDNENFLILLLRPESIDEKDEAILRENLHKEGIQEEKILSEVIPVHGTYENKIFITDPTIISDFIFLAIKEHINEHSEVIIDISRGLNFLIILFIEAIRRLIVFIKAKNLLSESDPEFFHIFLTPKENKIWEMKLRKLDAPFFFDLFKNKNKIPFNFDKIENKEEICKEFNFVKKIINLANIGIYALKRGLVLFFLIIIDWKEVEGLLSLSQEKLGLIYMKDLDQRLSYEKENLKERKYSMNYTLGNLWIYIAILENFYKIYNKYKGEIKEKNNLKWVELSTLKEFNEKIIKEIFKEESASIILNREIEAFEKSFENEKERSYHAGSSDIKRNFLAHAGLIFEFIEQDPKNRALTYKLEKHRDIKDLINREVNRT